MDPCSGSVSLPLERLPFNNTALRRLPVDDSEAAGSRTVPGACFSRIRTLQPLLRPTFVAVSASALALLGLSGREVLSAPLGPDYLSGSRLLPGSEPAAHCYSGHQFGLFAGQLGDGAALYLGEVEGPGGQGRWEIQVKGAGVTPYSRFGSFEIFLGRDEFSGLQGPSAGRHDVRAQLLDYVIESFYPSIQRRHSNRKERNTAFFREVAMRTAKLVAQWQSVGFCHGVLNTDNMSILGLTLDYGPFGFMDRFDPDFVCNASDRRGRYSYRAQPSVCRWNLARLAEALGSELHGAEAGAVLDDFMPAYEAFYLGNMRRKLGLLRREEAEDGELVSDLLRLMHNTGADFTNTFRLLSRVPWPAEGDRERSAVGAVVDAILDQCADIEELKRFGEKAYQDNIELAMILSMAQTNPVMFGMVADRPEVSQQLERMGRLKELLATDQAELREKQRDDWIHWVGRYRSRLARECDGASDPCAVREARLSAMNSTNPRVVLRNYIAQNAIQAAERGDFSEVHRILEVLENPYSDAPGAEPQDGSDGRSSENQKDREPKCEGETDYKQLTVGYGSKPPAWARGICVT
ncbi:selenoprotein O2 isoform X4 [Myripristis murdjan]|uniref:selenoprotein O2 isoform X4 n=1 Tax=Myripristis murdjan TaxID=586833 RepID=UPI00117603A7|nr:protein adenylyltransferase SelO-1, mitochondrial-like isoform X4 [Myripristis murdjan]